MAAEDDEFHFALSMYLRVGDPDARMSFGLPLDIAQAAGRRAAESGYSIRVNPFDMFTENPYHCAWASGTIARQ